MSATLLERDSDTDVLCFPVEFTKFLRTRIFTKHLKWLRTIH